MVTQGASSSSFISSIKRSLYHHLRSVTTTSITTATFGRWGAGNIELALLNQGSSCSL